MASYIGDYIDDFGNNYPFRLLNVGIIAETTIDTTRGQFNFTSTNFDSNYLPSIFILRTKVKTPRDSRQCPFDFIPRFAKLYLTESSYLKIPVPFKPNTTNFNQFFLDFQNTNLEEVLTIGYQGEILNNRRLNYAR